VTELLRKLFLVLIFLSLSTSLSATGLLPSGPTEYEFVYDRLERIDALSRNYEEYQLGPYSLDLAADVLGPFFWLGDVDRTDLRLFSSIQEQALAAKGAQSTGYESIRAGLIARPTEKLYVYTTYRLDQELAKDPDYTGKKWRGLAGGVENAFVAYRSGGLAVQFGRFASFWGPRKSLALAAGVALDGFAYSYRWGRLTLSYRLARLDGLNPERDGVAQFENRYFAGHRLDLHLSRTVRIGFFETAIFGGPGRQLDFYYLNPILFFHSAQLNENSDDNTFLGFDFTVKPVAGVKLYGQLLVDDFQLDDKEQSDQEPNEIGLLVGGYAADVMPSIDITAEYSRVTNRTFNQILTRNRYVYHNQLIGAALGNDYDLAELAVIKWFAPTFQAAVRASYRRQGEGLVNDQWTMPWLDIDGDYDEPFPTGTVEKIATLSLQVRGFILDHFYVDLNGGIDLIRNNGNISGDDRDRPFVRLTLSTFGAALLPVQ